MSKKSRRFRTPNLPPEAYAAAANPGAAAPIAAPAAAASQAAAPVFVDLKDEYKEVLGDLRKTFIIFISMVVVMLALSFVI